MSLAKKGYGMDWIDKIPEGWEVRPLRFTFGMGRGLGIKKTDLVESGMPVISYGQIHAKDNPGTGVKDSLIRYISPDSDMLDPGCMAEIGDIIMADTSEDLEGCGNCVYVDRKGIYAGYHTVILRNKMDVPNAYFAYLFKSDEWRSQLRSAVNRVKVYSITQRLLSKTDVLCPPIEVQESIVRYLDAECNRIDRQCIILDQMNGKLKELKQAIITESVTRGLNVDVKMVDSDVDWIDKIPEGWEVRPLRFTFGMGRGLGIKKTDLVESGMPVISYGQIHAKDNPGTGVKDSLIRYISPDSDMLDPGCMAEIGDIIMADTSEDLEGCGNCVYVDRKGIYAGYQTILLHNSLDTSSKYYAYLFLTDVWRSQLRSIVNSVKVYHITYTKMNQIDVIRPPVEVRESIVQYLDTECSRINHYIRINESLIEKLQEYRKSTISEFVTGKKEVPR